MSPVRRLAQTTSGKLTHMMCHPSNSFDHKPGNDKTRNARLSAEERNSLVSTRPLLNWEFIKHVRRWINYNDTHTEASTPIQSWEQKCFVACFSHQPSSLIWMNNVHWQTLMHPSFKTYCRSTTSTAQNPNPVFASRGPPICCCGCCCCSYRIYIWICWGSTVTKDLIKHISNSQTFPKASFLTYRSVRRSSPAHFLITNSYTQRLRDMCCKLRGGHPQSSHW